MNTVAVEWESYARAVVPKDAPPVQMQECRRAFYAGAQGMLRLVTRDVDTVSEDAAMALMDGWQYELALFARQVADGKA